MPKLTPHLWFNTQAVAAADYYVSVFPNSKILHKTTMSNTPSGTIDIVTISLDGQDITMMSAGPAFNLTEAFSFIINCKDQAEIDYYWEKLSAAPESEACGWAKDQFGVSWQIVPEGMDEMMTKGDQAQIDRKLQAMLQMKKIIIADLK